MLECAARRWAFATVAYGELTSARASQGSFLLSRHLHGRGFPPDHLLRPSWPFWAASSSPSGAGVQPQPEAIAPPGAARGGTRLVAAAAAAAAPQPAAAGGRAAPSGAASSVVKDRRSLDRVPVWHQLSSSDAQSPIEQLLSSRFVWLGAKALAGFLY